MGQEWHRNMISQSTPPHWQRNLWIVWAAQFLGMIGMSACLPFIPFYLREIGTTDPESVKLWSGLILSGPFFASILVAPLWGALGDRLGLKLMVVRAFIGLALALVFMAFVTTALQLFMLRVAQGLVSGFIAASIAFVSSQVPEERSSYALGVLQTSTSTGAILGPVAGGLLADTIGMRNVFVVVAAMCLVSGVAVGLLVTEHRNTKSHDTRYTTFENIRFVMQQPHLARLMTLLVVVQFTLMLSPVLLPFLVEAVAPNTVFLATMTGILLMARGIVGALAAPWWGRIADRRGHAGLLRIALLTAAIVSVLHSVAPSFASLVIIQALFGLCSAAPLVLLYGAVSKVSPRERRGGIMGVSSSATQLGHLGGPLMGGALASIFGLRPAFLVVALLFACILALIPRSLRKPNDVS